MVFMKINSKKISNQAYVYFLIYLLKAPPMQICIWRKLTATYDRQLQSYKLSPMQLSNLNIEMMWQKKREYGVEFLILETFLKIQTIIFNSFH